MRQLLKSKAERIAEKNIKRGLLYEDERDRNIKLNYKILLENEFEFDQAATAFFENVKATNIAGKGALADVSDMYEAAFDGRVMQPLRYGHESFRPGYWKEENNAGNEAFAEMFSATVLHGESLKAIKSHFPESYEVFKEIIRKGI